MHGSQPKASAMHADGLHVQFKDAAVHVPVKALDLCDVAAENVTYDIGLLAAKSNDTRWLAAFIKPFLKPGGTLVGTRNGMNDDTIASIIGASRRSTTT